LKLTLILLILCDIINVEKDIKIEKDGKLIKTIKKGIYNHKALLLEQGFSVHGFINEDGVYEDWVDLYSKASHAGPSYFEGISDLNNSYLGYEMLLAKAETFQYFKLLCHNSQKERDDHEATLVAANKKLNTEKEQILDKAKNKVNAKYKTAALKQVRINKIDEEIKLNDENIELLKHKAYPKAQVTTAVDKTREWMSMFAIPVDYVLRHADISGEKVKDSPKWDPGDAFDWAKFKEELKPRPILQKTFTLTSHPINLDNDKDG
jgi:N-acetyl-anhydromuramyl-L-alanine amidase AmpD